MVLTSFLLWVPGRARTVNGSFRGNVTDQAGALVLGALVKATNEATGVSRQASTDASGSYVLTNMPPGVCDLTVSYTGFTTFNNRGVTLLVDQAATLDFSLSPGAMLQQVTVTGQAPLVNFTNAMELPWYIVSPL